MYNLGLASSMKCKSVFEYFSQFKKYTEFKKDSLRVIPFIFSFTVISEQALLIIRLTKQYRAL